MVRLSRRALEVVRRYMRREYQLAYINKGGYKALAQTWGLSHGTVWRIINISGYIPKSAEILSRIKGGALERGLINPEQDRRVRIDLDASIDKDILKAIRAMPIQERTEILINHIKQEARK